MINRKNIIVIAIMAIMLMGSVVLSAWDFDINVHCTANGIGTFSIQDNVGTRTTNRTYSTGSNSFIVPGSMDYSSGKAYAKSTNPNLPASDSDGFNHLFPFEVNHFYLDIDGNGIYDPYQPNSQ